MAVHFEVEKFHFDNVLRADVKKRLADFCSSYNLPTSFSNDTDCSTARQFFSEAENNTQQVRVIEGKDAHLFLHSPAFHCLPIQQLSGKMVVVFRQNIEEEIGDKILRIACPNGFPYTKVQVFLKKALPQQMKPNVSIVLLSSAEVVKDYTQDKTYDGHVFSIEALTHLIGKLSDEKFMLLPQIECAPHPLQTFSFLVFSKQSPFAQEIIDAFSWPDEMQGLEIIIKAMNNFAKDKVLLTAASRVVLPAGKEVYYYEGKSDFSPLNVDWSPWPEIEVDRTKSAFSASDFMASFFDYSFAVDTLEIPTDYLFIANYKALQQVKFVERPKQIWAAGSRSWFELSRNGYWVNGCADAFGLAYLAECVWNLPLLQIEKEMMSLVTNTESAESWRQKGWKAFGSYSLLPAVNPKMAVLVAKADYLFWTSFIQYETYKEFVKSEAIHFCPYGETVHHFQDAGISPLVFPNIKALIRWKQINFPSATDA